MTLSEFKAWFEGFSEGIEGALTEAQFSKIKAKVALITGTATTYPVFVDRYWRSYDRMVGPTPSWPYLVSSTSLTGGAGSLYGGASGAAPYNASAAAYGYIHAADKGDNQTVAFDAQAAFHALGKAEATN